MLGTRERRYGFAYLLLALNGLITQISVAAHDYGWLPATLNLFNISAIVWLALSACVALLWAERPGTTVQRGDGFLLGLAVVVALVPIPVASSVLLTLLSGWGIASGTPGSAMRRASLIALSLTAFLLWGRIGLAWGAGPLLTADASFVGLLANTRSVGNAVFFADGTKFLIAPGCSSLHGVSLALILWTSVVQHFAIALGRRVWWTLALAVFGSILVNGVRLSIIAWNPHDFGYWHTGGGGLLFGWIALGAIAAIVYAGVSRALRMA